MSAIPQPAEPQAPEEPKQPELMATVPQEAPKPEPIPEAAPVAQAKPDVDAFFNSFKPTSAPDKNTSAEGVDAFFEQFRDKTPKLNDTAEKIRNNIMMSDPMGESMDWLFKGPLDRIFKKFAEGLRQGRGDHPLGISEENAEWFRNASIFKRGDNTYTDIIRGWDEAFIRPMIVGVEATFRALTSVVVGGAHVAGQISDEVGDATGLPLEAGSRLSRDITSGILESPLFGWAGYHPFNVFGKVRHPLTPKEFISNEQLAARLEAANRANVLEHILSEADALHALKDPEAVFVGDKPPAPRTEAEVKEAVKQAQENAAAEGRTTETPIDKAAEEPAPKAPTVHEVARGIDPETFEEQDRLKARVATLGRWLRDLREKADDVLVGHLDDQIRALEDRIETATPRLAKKYAARLEALEAERDKLLEENRGKSNPDIEKVQAQYNEADYALRDLAPKVNEALRAARDIVPEEGRVPVEEARRAAQEVATGAEEAKTLSGTPEALKTSPEAGKPAAPAPEAAPAAEAPAKAPEAAPTPPKEPETPGSIESQKAAITAEVENALVRAGRDAEEANAWAQLVAEYWTSLAEVYGGERGSALDWFRREGPYILGPGARRKAERVAAREMAQTIERDFKDFANPVTIDRDEVMVSLSASTGTIPGINELRLAAEKGDKAAALVLQGVGRDALEYLMSGIPSAKVNFIKANGLYGGELEASLGMRVSFDAADRGSVLAALAKFADNFNQEQVHVRGQAEPGTGIGHQYSDGSYNTPVIRFNIETAMSRSEIEKVIKDSGLYGLTATDKYLEAYYVGDPADTAALGEFERAIERADKSLGKNGGAVDKKSHRFWAYGKGDGIIPYERIAGDVPKAKGIEANRSAQRIAAYISGRAVKLSEQGAEITDRQRGLQQGIRDAYDRMKTNNLADPNVRRAYEALADEVMSQFKALPIKVEVWDNPKEEPYKTSKEMREDVQRNNHLYIYGTEKENFGPPGVTYDNHPLLEKTGLKDVNGRELLANDLLRAVHDYYAHTMTVVDFGPKGEEAAWRNHMAMTVSPWAKWALTSETRGQNSWVNFRNEVEGVPLRDRGFAEQKVDLLPVEYAMTGDPHIDAGMEVLPGHGETEFSQTVSIRNKKENLKKFGLDPDKPHTIREVAVALEKRQIAKYGKIAEDDFSPEAEKKIAKHLLAEIEFEIQSAAANPEKSPIGWYTKKYQKTLDLLGHLGLGEFLPDADLSRSNMPGVQMLKTPQNARSFFTAILAVTSDGTKVTENFDHAWMQYEHFREHGKFDLTTEKGGERNKSMMRNLQNIQEFLEDHGPEEMHKVLLDAKTVSELNKMAKDKGIKFNSGYLKDQKLPFSAVVFGPKLGAFYANLMGETGYLTMDRWWSRTINRLRGTLVARPSEAGLKAFRELLAEDRKTGDNALTKDAIDKMSDDKLLEIALEYVEKYKAKGWKDGTKIETVSNTLTKAAFEKLEDEPFNGSDRAFMIRIAERVRKSLERRGMDYSVADIQAILWYYEKRLVADLGARGKADVSYEEAARSVAEKRGHDVAGASDRHERSVREGAGKQSGTEGYLNPADSRDASGEKGPVDDKYISDKEEEFYQRVDGPTSAADIVDVGDGNAAYTAERFNREFHISSYPDGRSKASIAFVNPMDFVKATTSERRGVEDIRAESGALDKQRLSGEIQSPFLKIDDGVIVGHEGRHRMIALADAGIKRVPVILSYRGEAKHRTASESLEMPGQYEGSSKIVFRDVIPLDDAHKAKAKETFVGQEGKEQVLFQSSSDFKRAAPKITNDLAVKILAAYNENLPTVKEEYNRWGHEKSGDSFEIMSRKDLEQIYGDKDGDIPEEALKILEQHGSVIYRSLDNGNRSQFLPPNKMTEAEHIQEVMNDLGYDTVPKDNIDDIMEGGVDVGQAIDAFKVMAEALGFEVDRVRNADSRYMSVSKKLSHGQEIRDADGDVVEDHIVVGVRVSDHSRTSEIGHAVHGKAPVHINIAPQVGRTKYGSDNGMHHAMTFSDAYYYLSNVYMVPDGNGGARPEVAGKTLKLFQRDNDLKNPDMLKQRQLGKITVTPGDAKNTIRLSKHADATTFGHEKFGHDQTERMMRLAEEPDAPPQLKADAKVILDYVGAKRWEEGTKEQIRARKEKVADLWERYFLDGIAPTKALAAVFERIKQMVIKMYDAMRLKEIPESIPDDVRQVFDRVIARNPDDVIITGEKERPSSPHEVHEAVAEKAQPHEAKTTADRVQREILDRADNVAPEVADELRNTAGPELGADAASRGDEAGTRARENAASAGDGAERTGAGKASEEAGGTRGDRPDTASGEFSNPRNTKYFDAAGNIRLDNLNEPEDIKQLMREIADANGGFWGARRGIVSDQQVLDLADALGMDAQQLAKRKIGEAFNAEQIKAAQKLLIDSAHTVRDAGRDAATGDEAALLKYAEARARHMMIQEQYSGITAEGGRALRALRKTNELKAALDLSQSLKEDIGLDLFQLKREAEMASSLNNAAQVSKFMMDARKASFWDMVGEYFMASILFRVKTHLRNLGGSGYMMLDSISNSGIAGVVGAGFEAMGKERGVYIGETKERIFSMLRARHDALSAGVYAFKNERMPSDMRTVENNHSPKIPSKRITKEKFEMGSEDYTKRLEQFSRQRAEFELKTGRLLQHAREQFAKENKGKDPATVGEKPGADKAAMVERRVKELMANPPLDIHERALEEFIDIGGAQMRGSLRALSSEDEFFRLIAHREELGAIAYRTAMTEGLDADPVLFRQRVEELIANPTDEMMNDAMIHAKKQTFTTPLGEFGNAISRLANLHPLVRILAITFVRTPANILKFSFEHSPASLISRDVRDNMLGNNGAVARDKQIARFVQGSILTGGAIYLAMNGSITGGGPVNPDERKTWMQAGNRPYSVTIGSMTASYNWLPIGSFLGIAADFAKAMNHMSKGEIDKIAGLLLMSAAHNITDQSWMQGAAKFTRMTQEGERWGEKFFEDMAGSFVPGFIVEATTITDPYQREAWNILKAVKNRIPGASETLTPKRDMWGQEMKRDFALSPMAPKKDPVATVMDNLGIGWSPVNKQINGVKLTEEQYDQYAMWSGMLARQTLGVIVTEPGFTDLPDFVQRKIIKDEFENARENAAVFVKGMSFLDPEHNIPAQAVQRKLDIIEGVKKK